MASSVLVIAETSEAEMGRPHSWSTTVLFFRVEIPAGTSPRAPRPWVAHCAGGDRPGKAEPTAVPVGHPAVLGRAVELRRTRELGELAVEGLVRELAEHRAERMLGGGLCERQDGRILKGYWSSAHRLGCAARSRRS